MSLSFKIERAAPTNKQAAANTNRHNHLASDSSDDDQADHRPHTNQRDIQFISHFDSTREPTSPTGRSKKQAISIPALPDRDFRAIHLARKQKRAKKELYRPEPVNLMGSPTKESGLKEQNVDAEGLDKMNSKAIEGGLKPPTTTPKTQKTVENPGLADEAIDDPPASEPTISATPARPLTIEERAVKELLAQANPESTQQTKIEAIPMRNEGAPDLESENDDSGEHSGDSGDETAQFRRDVSKRPDCSTLEDYERIPVGQFGLALLKGMGWKEGTAATKRGRVGLVEAYVPQARPSLLGIGAKPLVSDSDPTDTKKPKASKPDKKYVPLLRKVIDQGGNPRSRSRSPANGNSTTSSSPHDRSSSDSSSRSTRRDRDSPSHREADRPSRPHDAHLRDDERDERGHRHRHADERRSSHRSDTHSRHHSSSSSARNYSQRPSSRDHNPSR